VSHDAYFKRFDELTALPGRELQEMAESFGLSADDVKSMDRDELVRFIIEAEGRRVVVRRGRKPKRAAKVRPAPPPAPIEEPSEDDGPTLDSLFSI